MRDAARFLKNGEMFMGRSALPSWRGTVPHRGCNGPALPRRRRRQGVHIIYDSPAAARSLDAPFARHRRRLVGHRADVPVKLCPKMSALSPEAIAVQIELVLVLAGPRKRKGPGPVAESRPDYACTRFSEPVLAPMMSPRIQKAVPSSPHTGTGSIHPHASTPIQPSTRPDRHSRTAGKIAALNRRWSEALGQASGLRHCSRIR